MKVDPRVLSLLLCFVGACNGDDVVQPPLDGENRALQVDKGDAGRKGGEDDDDDQHGSNGHGHGHEPAWPQWAQNPKHTGAIHQRGQPLERELADIIYDPLVPDELEATGGALLVHYQVPLVDGKNVYMEEKGGEYSTETFASQEWSESKFTWVGETLTKVWGFASDWQPPGRPTDFWEPVFHAALGNGYLYVPGAGGTVYKVDKRHGTRLAQINPYGTTVDANKYTVSPITVDDDGNLYYNVVEVPPSAASDGFYALDVVDSWLVKVTPRGKVSKRSYKSMVSGAPGATDQCSLGFTDPTTRPWPPPAGTPETLIPCGSLRTALNVAPTIGADGTVYTSARSHFADRYSYLIALKSDLTPKWSASLRNLFDDGCGVPISEGGTMPPNGVAPFGCREGAALGVDPQTGRKGDGRILDSASSTPTVAPDGTIFYGVETFYNGARGHLVRYSAKGKYLGAYPFGWDVTPGIHRHGSTYSVVIKDNYYIDFGPESPIAYYITQLSPDLEIEWRFLNTNTESCSRGEDGELTCVSDHPDSFEWCMNAPAIDKKGTVYANSEDGWLYAIDKHGQLQGRIFQQLALGAAYTPTSLGADGKVYSQNAGHMFVTGGD